MNKICILILILLLSFLNSCEKPIPACGYGDAEEIPWLQEKQKLYIQGDVYLYDHNGIDYIGISDESSSIDGCVAIFDCEGNLICYYGLPHFPPCDIGLSPRKLLYSFDYSN